MNYLASLRCLLKQVKYRCHRQYTVKYTVPSSVQYDRMTRLPTRMRFINMWNVVCLPLFSVSVIFCAIEVIKKPPNICHIMTAPNGVNASLASLKYCLPNGIPIIVI